MKNRSAASWLLSAFMTYSPVVGAESLRVPAEIFQPLPKAETPISRKFKAAPANQNKLRQAERTQRPQSITLGAPDSAELAQLSKHNSLYKALPIGIQRQLPTLPEVMDWVWTPVDGGEVGTFLIVSEQASRLRTLLRLRAALPEGVEIRIYQPESEQTVYGPFTQADFNAPTEATRAAGYHSERWTPTVAGDRLGIEIFAPNTVDKATIQLELPHISHILYDLQSNQFRNAYAYKLSSCDVSIACASATWQETAKAVARYIYTDSRGASFLCSGTLINDQNTITQEPYFLTAAHCVADANTAASMDFFWFHRETACGLDDGSWTQVSGGAELLVSRPELDASLVRINNLPPAGVAMSGWVLEALAENDPVHGIHHALGDIKQFSSGQFQHYTELTLAPGGYSATSNPQGNFMQVSWQQGITNQGSSGSGLWTTLDGQPFLKGTLVGGSSSCEVPDSPDQYSRFESFYPFASQWLGAVPLPSLLDEQSYPKPLTDGVMIARYMDGVRGNALLNGITASSVDLNAIESRLQDRVSQFDIDGNGVTEAGRDGLLLIRYLLGLRGASLIAEMDLTASPNNTATGITDFIAAALAGT